MKKLAALLFPLTLCMACAATPEDVVTDDVVADDGDDEGEAQDLAAAADAPAEQLADGDAEVIGTTSQELKRCGESLVTSCSGGRNPSCKVSVYYRHCTSGRGSIRVKANIRFYPDGRCITVGPNETRLIHVYGVPPGVFRRIDRC